MSDERRKTTDDKAPQPCEQPDDPLVSKLWREVCLIGHGLGGGLKQGAIESYHDPLGTAIRVGELAAINCLLVRSHAGGLLGLAAKFVGSTLAINAANDLLVAKCWMPVWSAMKDTFHNADHYDQNARVMEHTLGRFAFDTALAVGSGFANPKLYELTGKLRADLAAKSRIKRAFNPVSVVNLDSYAAGLETKGELAIGSHVLDWLADTKPHIRPKSLQATRAAMPVDELGLPYALSLDAWNKVERKHLLAEIRRMADPELAGEKHLSGAVNLLKQHTGDWSLVDLTSLRSRTLNARYEYDLSVARWKGLVAGDSELAGIPWRDLSPSWSGFRTRAEAKDAYAQRMNAYRIYRDLNPQLMSHYNARAANVQAALADLSRVRNLDGPAVSVNDGLSSRAVYWQGRRAMELTGRYVAQPGLSPYVVEDVLHEFSHYEQDVLSIRRLADELNIGRSLAPRQLNLVKERYRVTHDCDVDERFMKGALKMRNGQRLTSEQRNYSLAVDHSLLRYRNAKFGSLLNKNSSDIGLLYAADRKLDSHMGGLSLAQRLAKGDDPARAVILTEGSPPPALQMLLEQARKIDSDRSLLVNWNEEGAKNVLRDQIRVVAQVKRQDFWRKIERYMDYDFEPRAWANGFLARITAHAMGIAVNSK